MKIRLNEMKFYGYHGVYQEERNLGQRFIVNLTVSTNPDKDREIRKLEETIDYTKIYSEIEDIMENQQFHILEDCANVILDAIFEKFPKVVCANVAIQKPSVPMKAHLKSVEIEIEGRRK
ncbi:MAG: dihydroneopterin aldolase [Candidatus Cloacimonadota bacterium]|nr:dihydroneopterin aldolase [Candidatus Cloacimonadota bacterium]